MTSRLLAADLAVLRRRRGRLGFGTLWLCAGAWVAAEMGTLAEGAGMPPLLGAALALAAAAGPTCHWVARGLELLQAACPRCRQPFFRTRVAGAALPSLAGRCGHCGLGLARPSTLPVAPRPPLGPSAGQSG